jgi:hypothetical protein
MQILTSFNKTITISFLLIGSLALGAEPIGEITEYKGSAGMSRDGESSVIDASAESDVLIYDTAQTQNGRMKIQFIGDEELELTGLLRPRPFKVKDGHENGIRHRSICFGFRWKDKEK